MKVAPSVLLLLLSVVAVRAFYLPGVAPTDYEMGELVPLKVNSLDSIRTTLPYEYYHLPFCKPEEGIVQNAESLGEYLTAVRIESSDYKLIVGKDQACRILCRTQLTNDQQKQFAKIIKKEYRVHM